MKVIIFRIPISQLGFPAGSVVKNSAASAEDTRDKGSIPESGRCPGVEKWQPTPLFLPGKFYGQWATVHGVTKSWTRLNEHTHKPITLYS